MFATNWKGLKEYLSKYELWDRIMVKMLVPNQYIYINLYYYVKQSNSILKYKTVDLSQTSIFNINIHVFELQKWKRNDEVFLYR